MSTHMIDTNSVECAKSATLNNLNKWWDAVMAMIIKNIPESDIFYFKDTVGFARKLGFLMAYHLMVKCVSLL